MRKSNEDLHTPVNISIARRQRSSSLDVNKRSEKKVSSIFSSPTHDKYPKRELSSFPDRTNFLCSLLKISGVSLYKKYQCYLDLGSGDPEIFHLNRNILKPASSYMSYLGDHHHILDDKEDVLPIKNNLIPLPDNSVDLITCYVSIHHFNHLNLILKEISRIIMPGGFLFIREHDVSDDLIDSLTPYLDLLHMMEFILHGCLIDEKIQENFYRHYWSYQELSNILMTEGFEIVGFQRYPTDNNPQQFYHALYQYNPNNKQPMEVVWNTGTTEYSLSRKNLHEWLKKSYSDSPQSFYSWFCRTVERKLLIPRSIIEEIIEKANNDLDFFKRIFIAKYSEGKILNSPSNNIL